MLGVVRLKRGDLDGAAEQLRLAAEAWTEDGQAEAALALTLALAGKAEEASSHLAKARKLSPNEALYQRAAEALAR
jgi:Flp pilus assembly protein TadD